MSFLRFFRTRVFGSIAASLTVVVIVLWVVNLPEQEKSATTAPTAAALAKLSPLAPVQAIYQPQPAPRPPANAGLATVFPASQLPDVATVQGARISLACLERNGADLSKPMPSKHCVFAANEQVAAQLQAWAQANGFEVRDKEMLHSHTGTPEYRFNLVRVEVPKPENIEREGHLILSAVQQTPGSYYQTWCGEIVR
jgi:hypothetical protein